VKQEYYKIPTKPDRLPGDDQGGQGQKPNFSPGKGGGDGNWRPFLIYGLILLLFPVILILYTQNNPKAQEFTYHQFDQYVGEGRIVTAEIHSDSSGADFIKGQYRPEGPGITDEKALPYYRVVGNLRFDPKLKDRLVEKKVKYNVERDNPIWATLWTMLPFILILVILWFFFARQINMAGRGAMAFGKSRAKLMTRDKNKITFKDIAGVDEAKDEVQEIVEFLKDPKRFQRLGGRMPKGILMVGAPGTGKTMLAKAIAGEADVPFFSISGSDFVEMFVGVGAARVRSVFERAKKQTPSIIFMDEVDAVGRQRGAGLGGGHDEREQTLNQLLVEMDGFDPKQNIIVIAATNRPDILDPALLRPGRFDRQIVLDKPDLKGREAILKIHARGKPFAGDVDLKVVAQRTSGFTGADLENVLNEAAILAVRVEKKEVTMEEIEEAVDRVMAGPEKKSRVISDKEKKMVAYHEVGHAVLSRILPNADNPHKISILPRGMALGYTLQLPLEDKYLVTRSQALDQITVMMGGRVAEEIIFNEMTSGAHNDLERATALAKRMVTEFGMSALGPRTFGRKDRQIFLGRDIAEMKDYSEQTADSIDREVEKIINESYGRAKTILQKNRGKIEEIAKVLIEKETLENSALENIMKDLPKEALPAV